MNRIVLTAVLSAVVLNVTCLPSSPDTESYSWGDSGVDPEETNGFDSYGNLDDSARPLAPEPQRSYGVPINVPDNYNRYTGNFAPEPYIGEPKYWPNPEDRVYDERELYRRGLEYLLQIVRGSQAPRPDFGRRAYEISAYPYEAQKHYQNEPSRYGNAYNLGPLQPERRFQSSDIYMNEPYTRVDMQPSPVYSGM